MEMGVGEGRFLQSNFSLAEIPPVCGEDVSPPLPPPLGFTWTDVYNVYVTKVDFINRNMQKEPDSQFCI